MRTTTLGACCVLMNRISVVASWEIQACSVVYFCRDELDSTFITNSALQYPDVEAAASMENLKPATTGVLSVTFYL